MGSVGDPGGALFLRGAARRQDALGVDEREIDVDRGRVEQGREPGQDSGEQCLDLGRDGQAVEREPDLPPVARVDVGERIGTDDGREVLQCPACDRDRERHLGVGGAGVRGTIHVEVDGEHLAGGDVAVGCAPALGDGVPGPGGRVPRLDAGTQRRREDVHALRRPLLSLGGEAHAIVGRERVSGFGGVVLRAGTVPDAEGLELQWAPDRSERDGSAEVGCAAFGLGGEELGFEAGRDHVARRRRSSRQRRTWTRATFRTSAAHGSPHRSRRMVQPASLA